MSSNFTTIRIASLTDSLWTAYDAAIAKVAGQQRWINALDAACDWLWQREEIQFDATSGTLLFENGEGQAYESNGVCQCIAYRKGQPCRHRAAARLVANALNLQEEGATAPTATSAALMSLADERIHLAGEVYSDLCDTGLCWEDAQDRAGEYVDAHFHELMSLAARWDAEAAALRDFPVRRAA